MTGRKIRGMIYPRTRTNVLVLAPRSPSGIRHPGGCLFFRPLGRTVLPSRGVGMGAAWRAAFGGADGASHGETAFAVRLPSFGSPHPPLQGRQGKASERSARPCGGARPWAGERPGNRQGGLHFLSGPGVWPSAPFQRKTAALCKGRRIGQKTPEQRYLYSGLVEEGGFEPPKRNATDLQSAPFGHSGTPPYEIAGAGGRIRTPDLLITNQLLYRLSYTSISRVLSNSRCYFTRKRTPCQLFF